MEDSVCVCELGRGEGDRERERSEGSEFESLLDPGIFFSRIGT